MLKRPDFIAIIFVLGLGVGQAFLPDLRELGEANGIKLRSESPEGAGCHGPGYRPGNKTTSPIPAPPGRNKSPVIPYYFALSGLIGRGPLFPGAVPQAVLWRSFRANEKWLNSMTSPAEAVPHPTSATAGGDITGTVKVTRARSSENAVVYIEKIPGKTFDPPKDNPAVDQKNMTFIPHVLPVLIGTTVNFKNSDPELHNIYTPSPAGDKFNLGTWPAGNVKTYTFKKPGIVKLLCNLHPEMLAFIVVVETPYYAVTDRKGAYTIKNVPPGAYKISAWHERANKVVTQDVTVPATGTVTVDFTLP